MERVARRRPLIDLAELSTGRRHHAGRGPRKSTILELARPARHLDQPAVCGHNEPCGQGVEEGHRTRPSRMAASLATRRGSCLTLYRRTGAARTNGVPWSRGSGHPSRVGLGGTTPHDGGFRRYAARAGVSRFSCSNHADRYRDARPLVIRRLAGGASQLVPRESSGGPYAGCRPSLPLQTPRGSRSVCGRGR